MIDDSNTRKEQLMFNIIDELIENDQEVHWSTGKLKGSGKSPSQTSKDKATDLIRKAVNPRRDEPKLTGRQRTAMKERGKQIRALVTSGPTERPSVRSRGQSPQKERDANTVTGDLPKVAAGIRIRDGHRVGGEGDNTIVTGIHGPTDKGTGRGIRNKATRASTIGTLGVKSKGLNASFDLIMDLIEANPPKPDALPTIGLKHERRTKGMTARAKYGKDGNIELGDVWLPPGERNKRRGGSYVDGLTKFADKTGKSVSLKQDPEEGQADNLNRFYAKRNFKADDKKPGRYIRHPKTVNAGYEVDGDLIEANRRSQLAHKRGITSKPGEKSRSSNQEPKGIVTVGLPASGKSSLARHMVSKGKTDQHELDKSRKALGKGPAYFGPDIVNHSKDGQKKSREQDKNSVVSNTSIPKVHRKKAESDLKDAGYNNVTSVLAPGSTKAAMRRNRKRKPGASPGEGQVPQFVMNRMNSGLKSLKRSDTRELRKNFKKLHKQERFTKPAMKKSQAINSSYEYELTEKYVKANDPSGKGPDHRKRPEDKTRRKPTPEGKRYSEAEFGAAGKSPSTLKTKDVRRSVVGSQEYNEELTTRFRNRIEEAMSPKFSRIKDPKKVAAKLGAIADTLERNQRGQEINPEPEKKRRRTTQSFVDMSGASTQGRTRNR